jgi:1-aminocyclopropane-1-carboxylate deaminase/D-cysteine desulfhydrase-like pyridoxal-dependent ACC family enzyme
MLFNTSIIPIDTISNSSLQQKNVSLSVLRLDKIHPIISGNKLFKLHYFLDEAIKLSLPGIITFGGAHSNHLVATAYACKTLGLKSIGFVRGEKLAKLSNTLIASIDYGMQLHFISRESYKKKEENYFFDRLNNEEMRYLVVPEGGYHPKGSAGAALITQHISEDTTHICTALGTATTLAGLLIGAEKNQRVIGVPVLKGMHDVTERVNYLAGNHYSFQLLEGYHFGGYAKKTAQLINFMNQLYCEFNLSTDFVYTAKMMFAVLDSVKNGLFAPGSKITCVHTGGLQGNLSLPAGTLIF